MVRLTYYLDVLSSWCFYFEPHLEATRKKFGPRLSFEWRIALVTDQGPQGYTRDQVDWYYKRSGSVSGTHLNSEWNQGPHTPLVPNQAAEAARELGFGDDRVRLALAKAALIEGQPIYRKDVAVGIVAAVTGLEAGRIWAAMDDPKLTERIKRWGEEFAALNIDQRPGLVLRNHIGDIAIFSGIWRSEPLDATIAAMLADEEKYERFAAENPPIPAR